MNKFDIYCKNLKGFKTLERTQKKIIDFLISSLRFHFNTLKFNLIDILINYY